MRMTEGIMGMSVAVEILDLTAKGQDIDEVLDYFDQIDRTFSTYKKDSEISKINRKTLKESEASSDVRKVLKLCAETKKETNNYFDVNIEGIIDPSGLVKGYAINEASKKLQKKGYRNFYVEIGGDIAISGFKNGLKWKVGIQDPNFGHKNVKVLHLTDCGVATSGTYQRGMHIYDPVKKKIVNDIKSLTVVGPNIYEADRFATAAFAMGEKGLDFLENKKDLEALLILNDGKIKLTSGFPKYFY